MTVRYSARAARRAPQRTLPRAAPGRAPPSTPCGARSVPHSATGEAGEHILYTHKPIGGEQRLPDKKTTCGQLVPPACRAGPLAKMARLAARAVRFALFCFGKLQIETRTILVVHANPANRLQRERIVGGARNSSRTLQRQTFSSAYVLP